MLARRAASNNVANHDDPSSNSHPSLERSSLGTVQLRKAVDDCEGGVNRTFGGIFLGLRITKVGKHTITHELGDKTIEPGDCASACVLVTPDQRAHLFG